MRPKFEGVIAAPNQSEITAKVLNVEQSSKFADKWYLDLEIFETKDVKGPNFARKGQSVKGFTFESISNISPDSIIIAQAEFVGDERGGQFRLTRVMAKKP